MTAVTVIAGADFAERTRRFAFLVIVAAAVYAGYLYVPGAHASYSTVTINEHRGVYNAPYIGAAITLLTTAFLSLFGFFFVRGAVRRDWDLRVDGIVAAAPVRRMTFLYGKWLSNVLVLLAVAAITSIAAIGMQEWHGEDRALNAAAYVMPFLLITVPAMSFVAALATIFDVIPILRGILGGAIYVMVIWASLLAVPVRESADLTRQANVDPLGATAIVSSLYGSERAAFPREKPATNVSIGGSPTPKGGFTLYTYAGMTWAVRMIAERVAWVLISLVLVGAASFAFDGFRGAGSARKAQRRSLDVSRLVPALPGLRTFRAELALLLNGTSFWWIAGALALAVLGAVIPQKGAADFLLPIAFIWPLERISALGARERQHGVYDVLAATPGFTWRHVLAQWLAGSLVATFLVSGYLVRVLIAGDAIGAVAVVGAIAATVALALALGTITQAPRAFQATYLILWYLGPIQHLPELDVALQARSHPVGTAIVTFALAFLALAYASIARARAR